MSERPIGIDIYYGDDAPETPQIHVNFFTMRQNGAAFVIIKGCHGVTKDPRYDDHRTRAKQAGLLWAVYHFYTGRHEPKAQARAFWEAIKDDPPAFVVLDVENCEGTPNAGPYENWNGWYAFLENFKQFSGYTDDRIGIYCGFYYWVEKTLQKGISLASLNYFLRYFLWLGWYAAESIIKCPKPWTRWTIWQCTDHGDGLAYGLESKEADIDYFNGTMDELAKLFRVQPDPGVPIPEPTPEPISQPVNENAIRIDEIVRMQTYLGVRSEELKG